MKGRLRRRTGRRQTLVLFFCFYRGTSTCRFTKSIKIRRQGFSLTAGFFFVHFDRIGPHPSGWDRGRRFPHRRECLRIPPPPPEGEGRRVSSRQTRYLLLHQRKYPKSVSRGRTPWIPPSQLKCTDSFPSATYDGVRDSSDGLRPGADRVTEASCTQLGAWLRTTLRADAGNGGKAPQ